MFLSSLERKKVISLIESIEEERKIMNFFMKRFDFYLCVLINIIIVNTHEPPRPHAHTPKAMSCCSEAVCGFVI